MCDIPSPTIGGVVRSRAWPTRPLWPPSSALPGCAVRRSLCHAFEPGDRSLGRNLESGTQITIDCWIPRAFPHGAGKVIGSSFIHSFKNLALLKCCWPRDWRINEAQTVIKSITGYAFRVGMAQRNKEEGLTKPGWGREGVGQGEQWVGQRGLGWSREQWCWSLLRSLLVSMRQASSSSTLPTILRRPDSHPPSHPQTGHHGWERLGKFP